MCVFVCVLKSLPNFLNMDSDIFDQIKNDGVWAFYFVATINGFERIAFIYSDIHH